MAVVFADAGYFIASLNERDGLHARAESVTQQLSPLEIVTTEMVLVEVLNYYSDAGERLRTRASQLVLDLAANPDVEIIPQAGTPFQAAVARYASRRDQTWSLTDCASFIVMEQQNIINALAHDHDFEQAGFNALLRTDQRR